VAKQQRLQVEIPSAAEDKPRATRVGLVVLGGALVGVLSPWLLVPKPPGGEERALALASVSSAEPSASAAAPPLTPPPPPSAEKAAEPEPAPKRLRVSKVTVVSCRDKKDRRVDQCDDLAFDRIALPRFAALENCPAAQSAQGTLSLGFDLDLSNTKIARIASGKSTTLPAGAAEALVACAKKEFQAASLDGLKHEHSTYTLFYRIEFPGPDAPPPANSQSSADSQASVPTDATAASGNVTVGWVAAIIRDGPSRDGREIARVLSGTRMTVVARKGEWYKVKYDAKGSEGWVYKAAIGL
jgi:hypothetical protein